jgi:ABC-type polysaccharide/polyol phosphate export permease
MQTKSIHIATEQTATHEKIVPHRSQRALAFQDLLDGIIKWRLWMMLSYQDIKLRYRRSILGPFWITISMAITSYSMGYLYGHLFHIDLQIYYPYIVAGMLSWTLISSLLSELTDAFTNAENLIKQIKLPYSIHINRVVARNIITFFHNIIVYIPIIAIFHQVAKVNFHTFLIIPGLMIIYINAISYGLILAMIGARYRDLSQIIKSLIQVAFFLTPVMWNPSVLKPADQYIVALNPFYAFVELIRAPMMGMLPALSTFVMATLVTIIGIMICISMMVKYRSRIVYWI